jgi:beta-1,2-mannobiose phosphorylase / 1,2-beta-oligomannan phosphorylase
VTAFEVASIGPVTTTRRNRLANMYALSPFVWREGDGFHLLMRAVPRRDDEPRLKMAEIWYGTSVDGRHFEMSETPVIFPGPDLADLDGCEDPTVDVRDGVIRVWYTGYNHQQETGRLMLARGSCASHLAKVGVMIDSRSPRYINPKEATLVTLGSNRWRLFFEFARDGASLIGQADSGDLDGGWEDAVDAPLTPRPGQWDNWHVSAGPVIGDGADRPVMFYNGATQDAQWRIGWAAFDKHYTKVVARSDAPLIVPEAIGEGATDIAFAASAVETQDGILLYFSQSDQDLRCALVRRT